MRAKPDDFGANRERGTEEEREPQRQDHLLAYARIAELRDAKAHREVDLHRARDHRRRLLDAFDAFAMSLDDRGHRPFCELVEMLGAGPMLEHPCTFVEPMPEGSLQGLHERAVLEEGAELDLARSAKRREDATVFVFPNGVEDLDAPRAQNRAGMTERPKA